MSEGEGWIQRVFGGKPTSARAETMEEAIADRDRFITEKLQVILDLELRLAGLDTELGASSARSKAREAEVVRMLENAATAHDALAAELERSESSRAAEFAQGRRQLDSVQAVLQGVREELSNIKGRLAAQEAELAKKTEQLTDSEWRNQTLEADVTRLRIEEPKQRALKSSLIALQRDLEAARAERNRKDAQIVELQAAERTRAERVLELESAQARAAARVEELEAGVRATEQRVTDREARLSQLQAALIELSRLSAGALHGAFGDALHLAVELTANRGWQPNIDPTRGPAEVVEQLQQQLSRFGVVEELRIDLSGPSVRGELRLSPACAATEAKALSRWASAYAIECLNLVLPVPVRLESVSDESHGCAFTASARSASGSADAGGSGARRIARAS
ncbi:MAG: hypothetical protein RL685_3815 [Pseudomonadota bacterium]|jgi:hypothetical protein